jgi:hypothetical protein
MRHLFLFAAVCAALLSPATAREQIPAEERLERYTARIPGCEDGAVIERIKSRFASKESQYWNSSLTILAVDHIRPTAMRPNGLDLIPRRYCEGVAFISNHTKSRIFYSVIEDAGIIGQSWGVHFCVQAYDRNWASAPECKMARP